MGRPSKLTPERQQRLLDAIRAGNYYEPACVYAGIDYATFRRWMQRGEQATHGPYREFREAVLRAEAEAEIRAVALINKAMPDDWRAAQMFLERRHPERWGKREQVQAAVTGTLSWVDLAKQAVPDDSQ